MDAHTAVTVPGTVQQVGTDSYAYIQPDGSWWINNAGFFTGAHGVISVDTCSTVARTRAYQQAIASVTDVPVTTIVNTHHHGDHTHGNFLFPGATVISHRRCREEMIAGGLPGDRINAVWEVPDWGPLELRPPTVVFDEGLSLVVNDTEVEVRHLGTPAHTVGDSIVWSPRDSVLFAGDLLFNGGTPFLLMGSIQGMLETLDAVEALGARTIVPGHGAVCGPDLIETTRRYVRFVAELARSAVDDDLTPLDAARQAPLGEFADWLDSERIVGNLHRAMFELAGGVRGGPIDVVAALGDMVAFNGGRLESHA